MFFIEKHMYRFLLASIIALCAGCAHNGQNAGSQKIPAPRTFLDSIAAQMAFHFSQIRHNTIIGVGYFEYASDDSTRRNLSFSGDTIFYPKSAHPLAILNYSDTLGVCSKKLLLVYDKRTLKNTAYQLVEADWDIDYSTDDTQMSYKILNDSLFYVDEVYTERKGRKGLKTNKQTTTRQYFKIDNGGKIKTDRKKVVTVKLVDKTEDDK